MIRCGADLTTVTYTSVSILMANWTQDTTADVQNLPVPHQHDVQRLLAGTPIDSVGAMSTGQSLDSDSVPLPAQPDRRCVHRAVSHPSPFDIATTHASDILSSQATNKPELTAALFSDAQRIAYTLRLNAVNPPEGVSAVDIELGRRIFWHLYTTDKWADVSVDKRDRADHRTNVMNGGYMLVHHHEIIPPLPLEIDDEHLSTSTSQPHPQLSPAAPQTPNKQTYISGFVALCRIFVILGECQQRHRTLINDPEAGQDLPTLMRWLDGAVERLRRITDGFASDLPLRTSRASGLNGVGNLGGGGGGMGMDSDSEATAGIQQANICITALCAEFALVSVVWTCGQETRCRRGEHGAKS